MSFLGRASLIIIAISAPALAMGNPDYYYPSYYSPYDSHKKDSPLGRNSHLVNADLAGVGNSRPTITTPTQAGPAQAPPAYAPPAYGPPAAYEPPAYRLPAGPTMPVSRPPAVSPDRAYAMTTDASAYVPPDSQPYKSPADTPTHKRPVGNQPYKPPADISTYKPPADTHVEKLPADTHVEKPPADTHIEKLPVDTYDEKPPADTYVEKPPADTYVEKPPAKTSTYNPPSTSRTITHTEAHSTLPLEEALVKSPERIPKFRVPNLPKWGHGKPSPLPNGMDRRNAPRVSRQKRGNVARETTIGAGHARRLPFLKKRQQAGQHGVIPVTVNMITGIGHSASTSSAPTPTTDGLPPSQSPFAPGVDTSQAGLSLQSNPETTMPSVGELAPPVWPNSGSQHFLDLDTGEPRNKAAVIASILSIIIGLVVIVTVVKLTRNAMRRRKHAAGLRQYDEHLSSKEGLIPEMSVPAHFEAHDVIITDPDGSEISPLSSGRGGSPSPLPFGARSVGYGPSPLPMPTFAPPPTPTSPLSLPFVKLLSPTVNLARQNTMQSRASAMSETVSLSTTSTENSERRPASDGECFGKQVSHRRMRSAPGSVVWSARSSGATGKLTSGISGEEGYWESVDVCGSESVGGMVCRSSRGRSVAMSVMW